MERGLVFGFFEFRSNVFFSILFTTVHYIIFSNVPFRLSVAKKLVYVPMFIGYFSSIKRVFHISVDTNFCLLL